jgi:hypothetical protein
MRLKGKSLKGAGWINLAQGSNHQRALVSTALSLRVS